MKLGCISDIHIDVNRDFAVLELLAQKVRDRRLDALVIAGDISNHYTTTLSFLDRFIPLAGVPVYFVPGNHDMWDQSGGVSDSHEIYRRYQAHPACLIDRSVPLGDDWVLIGDIGWYDYSFGNPRYGYDAFSARKLGERTWLDSLYVRWNQPDPEVHRDMLARLSARLRTLRGKKIVTVTHMIAERYFIVPEGIGQWAYFNAFLGSKAYGELFERAHVRHSIMGHVHYRKRCTISGVDYICACLNYHTQWAGDDLEKELDNALTVLELEEQDTERPGEPHVQETMRMSYKPDAAAGMRARLTW